VVNFSRAPKTSALMLQRLSIISVVVAGAYAQAAPVVGGVVNAATFKSGAIAPGTLITIFGSGLSTSTGTASSVPLPTTLAGTVVLLNEQPISLSFVSPGQINAQLPFKLPNGSARLTIRDANGGTASASIPIADSSPGIFTITADGKGEAIATHSDSSLIKRASGKYARGGETVVLYCTGLGDVDGTPFAGEPAPISPLPSAIQKVEVIMNGKPANVVYAGLTPGSVGLYQINVVVPDQLGGDVSTRIRIGTSTSNETTINVSGTFTLGVRYTGVLQPRDSSEKLQLEFSGLSTTGNLFTGAYTISRQGVTMDRGTFAFQRTESILVVQGKSTAGDSFYAKMDTFDAGQSFIGVLLQDSQKQDSWYAEFTIVIVTATTPVPPAVLPGRPLSSAAVEGASVFGQHGKYLGKITWNSFDRESIGNTFGPHGSDYSATSIFNSFSQDGSEFSALSAFNELAGRPPIIYVNGQAKWYSSVKATKTPRIAPSQLYWCIGRSK